MIIMAHSFGNNIENLKKVLEKLLSWGDAKEWTNRDFENLSKQIFEKTNNTLSVSTLKRFWGRTEQKASPSITTLDILSQYAGYKSWRAFQKNQNPPNKNASSFALKKLGQYLLAGILIFAVIMLILSYIGNNEFSINKDALDKKLKAVEFDFEKVSTGFPNTVIFKYDVKDLSFDSLSIQQSWDSSKRIPLKESKGIRTSTYLFPGYFLTKLVWNNEIIKEKELYIPTVGWQGAVVRNNGEVHYFEDEIILENGNVSTEYQEQENDGELYLAYLDKEPKINSSNFDLNSTFRITDKFDHSTCHFSRIIVTGTKEVISLNFSIPGCVGALNHFINMKYTSGKNTDLSAFGVNQSDYIHCNLKMRDNILKVYLGDKFIYSDTLSSDIGKIGGVQFWFDGKAEISQLIISDNENEINYLSPN